MTDKEEKVKKLMKAQAVAHKIHILCMKEEPDVRVAFLGALMFAGGAARAMDMSLHDTLSGLMAIYKDADKFMERAKDDL